MRRSGAIVGICCLLLLSGLCCASTTAARAPDSIRHQIWSEQVHPDRSYVAPLGNPLRAHSLALDPRPLVDQIDDVLHSTSLAPVFGGDVLRPDGTLDVYVANQATSVIKGALAALSPNAAATVHLSSVARSWTNLETTELEIARDYPNGVAGSDWKVPMMSLDAKTNSILLDVTGNSQQALTDLQAKYPSGAFTTEPGEGSELTLTADNRYFDGDSGRYRGGDRVITATADNKIGIGKCTSGFAVKGRIKGDIYQTTAAHCNGVVVDQGGLPIENVATNYADMGADFETWGPCVGGELEVTCTGFVWTEGPDTAKGDPGFLPHVNGRCDCGEGFKVAMDGATSGENPDFTVNKDETCFSINGHQVCGLRIAIGDTKGSQAGDSGGPVYQRAADNNVYATGTIVGRLGPPMMAVYEPLLIELNDAKTDIVVGDQ